MNRRARTRLALILAFVFVSSSIAAADARWLEHRTDHFRFLYRASDSWAVLELDQFADQVFEEVTNFLGSSPPTVNVVLYGETDLANGFYSPEPPQHIALFLRHPTLPLTGARSESWLRVLLVHEVVHFVHANYSPGLFWTVGSVFGRSLTGLSIGLTPLWFTEGLGVYVETELTSGGRGRDPFFEMQYKAPVVEHRMFSLFQAGYDSYLAPVGRYYPAGLMILDYLTAENGPRYAKEVLAQIAGWPLFGIWGPVRRTSGEPMRTHYTRAVERLRERYADVPDPVGVRITPARRSDYYVPRSTEAGLLTYRTRPDAVPAIVRVDPQTGDEHVVLQRRLTDHASWSASADGGTIAFATIDGDRTYPDQPQLLSNIYLYNVARAETRQITHDGGYYQPVLAPDGTYLIAIKRNEPDSVVVRIDLDTDASRERVLLASPDTRFYTPAISSSGRIAAVANTLGDQRLFVTDGGRNLEIRGPGDGIPYFPSFTGEDELLFTSDPGGQLGLYHLNLVEETISLAATDPVGVVGATRHGEELFITVYTADGHALRRATWETGGSEEHAARVEALASSTVRSHSPTAQSHGGVSDGLEDRRYYSIPYPRVWLPSLAMVSPSLSWEGLGVGAFVLGADFLGRATLQLQSHYFPLAGTASYDATLAGALGAFRYTVRHASPVAIAPPAIAGDDPDVARTFATSGTFSWDLIRSLKLDVAHTLTVSSFADFFVSNNATLNVGGSVGYSRSSVSPARAYYSPGALSLAAGATVPLEGPSFAFEGARTTLQGSVVAGLGPGDHTLVFRPAVSIATSESVFAPYGLTGFADSTTPPPGARLAARASLELRTRRNLFDLPLLPSVGLTSQSFALTVESTASASTSQLAITPSIGISASMETVITYLTEFPIDLIARARVPVDGRAFDPGNDLAFAIDANLLGSIPTLP